MAVTIRLRYIFVMDRALVFAAHALAAFDPLSALDQVALRDDPEALILRAVALAQLGEFESAQKVLSKAAALIPRDSLLFSRCLAAQGEVSLAMCEVDDAESRLTEASSLLTGQGDLLNAHFVELQRVRLSLLMGQVELARTRLNSLQLDDAPPRLQATAALLQADLATKRLAPHETHLALNEALGCAQLTGLGPLIAQVEQAQKDLLSPIARSICLQKETSVRLDEVADILASNALVVDGCRRLVSCPGHTDSIRRTVSLVARPVLLRLCVTLASRTPDEATRETLAEIAFDTKHINDSVRSRLRVELGRLRHELEGLAQVRATGHGYILLAEGALPIITLLPPQEGDASALFALLCGGESWSSSALAKALGVSQRTVQRALQDLSEQGRVNNVGTGRAQRWVARPPKGFATPLLLDRSNSPR